MNNFLSFFYYFHFIQRTNSIFIVKIFTVDRFYNNRNVNFVFQLINKLSTTVDVKQFETAKLKENRSKNRYSNILPGEF